MRVADARLDVIDVHHGAVFRRIAAAHALAAVQVQGFDAQVSPCVGAQKILAADIDTFDGETANGDAANRGRTLFLCAMGFDFGRNLRVGLA